MAFRAPLTKADLHAIGQRQDAADINALLWEIARLRAIVLRADQLQRSLGSLGGGAGVVLNALRLDLQDEPCVAEQSRVPD